MVISVGAVNAHSYEKKNGNVNGAGMGQRIDETGKNIQNQIAGKQQELKRLSENDAMNPEEKIKRRQEINQEISDLNRQLRQHQMEQQNKVREKEDASKDVSGTKKPGSPEKEAENAGLTQAGMKAMVTADAAMSRAEMLGGAAARQTGRANVLGAEIMLDKARAKDGTATTTEEKENEKKALERKASGITESEMKTLREGNQAVKKARKEEEAETSRKEEEKKERLKELQSISLPGQNPDVSEKVFGVVTGR